MSNIKNNQKGFAEIFLIGLVVVIIAVAGYFAFIKKSEPVAEQLTPAPVVTQTNTMTSTSTDETANWKTYINTKYGYEFKYPENVGIVNEEDSTYAGPPSNPEEDMLLLADKEKTFYMEIDKNVVNVIKKSTLSDQILSTFKFTK